MYTHKDSHKSSYNMHVHHVLKMNTGRVQINFVLNIAQNSKIWQ